MSRAEFYVFHNKTSIELYPIQFGREACAPLHRMGPTQTHNYLFHYILSGQGRFSLVGQKAQTLSTGQGFLMTPDCICAYEADESDPWTYCWIEFNGLKAKHFLQEAGFNASNYLFKPKQQSVQDNIMAPLMQLINNPKQHESSLIGQLYLVMDALIRYSNHTQLLPQNDVHNFYIREAIRFIQDHFAESISIDDIAQHCNLNRNYFSKLFKQEMGLTPSQFILNYRMNIACQLLTNRQLSIQSIAQQVGYTNQFNFSAAFKRVKSLAPYDWRKLYA